MRYGARHNAPTMTTGADALAHFQERPSSVASRDRECANCGDTERALACCSRCRGAWFCSTRCQRAYWPFHRSWCRRNDFADVVERTEPKFARWMRAHGKQAVLKDDEVDRLERKVAKTEDFYGRANPKPTPPSFDAEDMRKMRAAEAARALAARDETDDVAWLDIQVPPALGIELEKYKWRQNQSYVEVFVKLPRGVTREDVEVALETTRIAIRVRGETVMDGELAATIKAELSTWFIVDGVIEVALLKKNRRGSYDDGCTNHDTFWRSLLADVRAVERLPSTVPSEYYDTEYEIERDAGNNARKSSSRPMISQRR